ncbi:MAG: radical SAM protein [Dehalococcoidia bacterium]|nr:radical SAM protein [Dehalococcoidia bacterium]
MDIFEPVRTALSVPRGRAISRTRIAFRHGTWKKFTNFLRVEAGMRMGKVRPSGHPYEWEIDSTNICQLHCPLCHTGIGTVNRIKGFMAFETFKKTIDQIKDHTIWLSLYSWGEPFLHRDIVRFIRHAHDSNIGVVASSNMNAYLSEGKAEEIVRSGLDALIMSIDGTTQEVYEKYRVGGQLKNVLANVKLLAKKKRELSSKTPMLEWQFIVMKHNEHQKGDVKRIAKELGVDLLTFKKVDFPHDIYDKKMLREFLPSYRDPGTEAFNKPYNEGADSKCWRLWRSGVVNWDGGYAPCCYLTDAKHDFANVNDVSIDKIWNGPQYTEARKMFTVKGYLPTVSVGCLKCNVYTESTAGVYTASLGQTKPVIIHVLSSGQNGHNSTGTGKLIEITSQNRNLENPIGIKVASKADSDKK